MRRRRAVTAVGALVCIAVSLGVILHCGAPKRGVELGSAAERAGVIAVHFLNGGGQPETDATDDGVQGERVALAWRVSVDNGRGREFRAGGWRYHLEFDSCSFDSHRDVIVARATEMWGGSNGLVPHRVYVVGSAEGATAIMYAEVCKLVGCVETPSAHSR